MYLIRVKSEVYKEDLPILPSFIQGTFADICEVLKRDPIGCCGLLSKNKGGKLRGYRSISLDYGGIAYRIIYRICDRPAPRRVEIIAVGEHDVAYENAQGRVI